MSDETCVVIERTRYRRRAVDLWLKGLSVGIMVGVALGYAWRVAQGG